MNLVTKCPTIFEAEVEAKVAEVKAAAQGDDVEKIKAATEALGQVIQKIGGAVYEQGPGRDFAGSGGGEAGPNPDPSQKPDLMLSMVK